MQGKPPNDETYVEESTHGLTVGAKLGRCVGVLVGPKVGDAVVLIGTASLLRAFFGGLSHVPQVAGQLSSNSSMSEALHPSLCRLLHSINVIMVRKVLHCAPMALR